MPSAKMNRSGSGHRLKLLSSFFVACTLVPNALALQSLTSAEVNTIFAQGAAYASSIGTPSVLAVVDREGFVLGVLDMGNRAVPLDTGLIAGAISRAGTAAFLSSNENAFTSRTAGYIIQQHFPVGMRNTPPGPLVGVGFSNLFFSDTNRFKQIPVGGASPSAVTLTSLADSPGGVPLYKNGELVGGVGVTGDSSPSDLSPAAFLLRSTPPATSTAGYKIGADTDENVALAAQNGFRPASQIVASNVILGGFRIPYVNGNLSRLPTPTTPLPLSGAGNVTAGSVVSEYNSANPPAITYTYAIQASPASPYTATSLGGVPGEIRETLRDDPLRTNADPLIRNIGNAERLTQAEVRDILTLAAQKCSTVRAGIRLPVGTRAKTFISVVNNPNSQGVPPEVLGVFRVGEATMFSWDVSVQKARTAVFFSNKQMAMSTRAVGFLAQRFFPPGLDGRPWGPLFGFQDAVTLKTAPGTATFPGNTNLPNGMTIFPGGLPLYRNGELIGAIGVSGDGVDQDDLVSASGCANFLPPDAIRADKFTYRGARLPYVKFPRNPLE